jgi:hypothetical protein
MSTMADLLVFGSANNARLGLFYALLSISANHLGSKIPWSREAQRVSSNATSYSGSGGIVDPNDSNQVCNYWLTQGSVFQNMATSHIRSCFQISQTKYDDQELYRELLMSLLSMVTISVSSISIFTTWPDSAEI